MKNFQAKILTFGRYQRNTLLRYSRNDEITRLLGSLGKIHKMTTKRQYKHHSVKVRIQLNSEYEKKFLNNTWQIEVGREKKMLLR